VTDLAGNGNDVLVSVGAAGGGLVRVDRPTMHNVGFVSEPDVRAAAYDPAGDIWCVSGAPALAHYAPATLAELGSSTVAGFGVAGAKGTLEAAVPISMWARAMAASRCATTAVRSSMRSPTPRSAPLR
jgi:hypothetical protein